MPEGMLGLVGQAFVDVALPGPTVRLGGVVHAARGLAAVGVPFDCVYFAPAYLADLVDDYVAKLGGTASWSGDVVGSPNVLLVMKPQEAGDQEYVPLLRSSRQVRVDPDTVARQVRERGISEVLAFPDSEYAEPLLDALLPLGVPVSADGDVPSATLRNLARKGHRLSCFMLSTSQAHFSRDYGCSSSRLADEVVPHLADSVLLKENRGGSRFFTKDGMKTIPAQTRSVRHSVGVGDCFSATFLAMRRRFSEEAALNCASWLAADYAATATTDEFMRAAHLTLRVPPADLVRLPGVTVPWEERASVSIYVAGPDFPDVDTSLIEEVAEALSYHNFRARLPIRENGRVEPKMSAARRRALARKDLELLGQCQLLVAVLPFEDPGTVLEIGAAIERGLPTLVLSPHPVTNLMLDGLPDVVTSDLDVLITGVFRAVSRRRGGGHGS